MNLRGGEQSDEQLMACLRAGDDGALRVLYDRHARPLYNFARRLLMDPASAEDVVQETFLRVYRDRGTFRPVATFKTWAFTIARNLCVDRLRATPYSPKVRTRPPSETVDPGPTPLERLERSERERAIERALADLSIEEREVLILSRFRGLKYREVAAILGISVDAVKMRVYRALTRLRKVLAP